MMKHASDKFVADSGSIVPVEKLTDAELMAGNIASIPAMLNAGMEKEVIAMHAEVLRFDKAHPKTPMTEAYIVALPPEVLKKLVKLKT